VKEVGLKNMDGVRLTECPGSIPVTLDFANILGLNVLLLPMGRGDDGELQWALYIWTRTRDTTSDGWLTSTGAHSTNEKLDTDNYIRGTKLLGSYLYELAAETK
jgi:Cys-Gly metallodipeptidase DUG1